MFIGYITALALMGYVVWQVPTILDAPAMDVQAVVYRLARAAGAFIGAIYLMMRF